LFLVRLELTELGAGRSAFSVAAVVASLLSAPRFRRSPPACPRTVRLRRYRSSQDSSPEQRSLYPVIVYIRPRGVFCFGCGRRFAPLCAPRFRRFPPACLRTVRLRRYRSSQDSSPEGMEQQNELGDRRCRHRRELLGAFSGDAFGGQECPPHTGFVASPLAAPRVQALPARLPANCPASSLPLLAGQSAQSWVCGKWGVCLVWRIGVRRGGFIGGRGWLRCGRSRGGGSRLLCLAAAGWGGGHHHVLVIADHVVGV
jgi:hypothetical protein